MCVTSRSCWSFYSFCFFSFTDIHFVESFISKGRIPINTLIHIICNCAILCVTRYLSFGKIHWEKREEKNHSIHSYTKLFFNFSFHFFAIFFFYSIRISWFSIYFLHNSFHFSSLFISFSSFHSSEPDVLELLVLLLVVLFPLHMHDEQECGWYKSTGIFEYTHGFDTFQVEYISMNVYERGCCLCSNTLYVITESERWKILYISSVQCRYCYCSHRITFRSADKNNFILFSTITYPQRPTDVNGSKETNKQTNKKWNKRE